MSAYVIFAVCALVGAHVLLLSRIWAKRDCTGISGKTQQLFALVFFARHFDLFSAYNGLTLNHYVLKIALIALSYCLVLSIYFFHWNTYQNKFDSFRSELLVFPCLVLALMGNYEGKNLTGMLWIFSVYLESVAIIPQVYHASRAKKVEPVVHQYIVLLALYKLIHVMDIIYSHFYVAELSSSRLYLAAGIVQLMFYCDFLVSDFSRKSDDEEAPPVAPKPTSEKNVNETMKKAGFGVKEGVILTPDMLVEEVKALDFSRKSVDEEAPAVAPKPTSEKNVNETTKKADFGVKEVVILTPDQLIEKVKRKVMKV